MISSLERSLRRDDKGRILGWIAVPPEIRQKISLAHKGKRLSVETRRKIAQRHKGRKPWNKGLTKETDERVRQYAEKISGARKGVGRIKPIFSSSPDLAYVLGCLKGDGWAGYVRGRGTGIIKLQAKAKPFVLSFMQALKSIGLNPRIHFNKNLGSEGVWIATASSRAFVDWYRSLKLEDIQNVIQGYESNFIRGFYESEGSIARPPNSPQVHIYNTDLRLLRFVKSLIGKLGLKSKIALSRKGSEKWKPCYQLYLCGKDNVKEFIERTHPIIKV